MPLSPHPGHLELLDPIPRDELVGEYTRLAVQWVAAGIFHHTATVAVADLQTQQALCDLGFGREQSYGTRKTAHIDVDPRIRGARQSDLEQILPLTPLIAAANVVSPVFAVLPSGFIDQLADAHRREFSSEHAAFLVAELDEKVVGFAMVNHSATHPLWPSPSAELTVAAVSPEHRGKGLGIALALAAINWAFNAGHAHISTDWRTANQYAARTWTRTGFNLTGWRMSRVIPSEATNELRQ